MEGMYTQGLNYTQGMYGRVLNYGGNVWRECMEGIKLWGLMYIQGIKLYPGNVYPQGLNYGGIKLWRELWRD